MPLVQVYVWTGRDPEFKKDIISGITKVFVEKGIPAQAVEVLVHEVPKDSWGMGGVTAAERGTGK